MKEKILQIDHSWLLSVNHFANSSRFWRDVFQCFGVYLIYLVPIILLVTWFWPVSPSQGGSAQGKKIALGAAFAGLFSWVIFAKILALIVKRPRPFDSGGFTEILFKRPDFSFPSDHAAFVFALTFYFYLSGYKKLAYFLVVLAVLISFARIGIGVHFPSDILSGAILGILGAWIVWLFEKPLSFLYNFIIAIAKHLRLA